MCGIVGTFAYGGGAPAGVDVILRMTDRVAHRGPDDEGTFSDADVALGFRRLSIIDLSSGHQPIHNEDKTVWTTLNGEIYNYRELRCDLERRGHTFYTNSDTEVLVHLYEDVGDALVHKLCGMFAFCIWDARRKRLIVCRDHTGIKPVFYMDVGGELMFASEIKALVASGRADRTIDVQALDHYFGLQYIPAPLTIYKGIRKLPAGHLLTVAKGEAPKVVQYWDLAAVPVLRRSLAECEEQYEATFIDAVRLQLRSDVPLGAFLSGGVDSSAVVAVMAELSDAPVNTFTIGHTEGAFDETADARLIAERFRTNHRTLTIGPDDFLRLIPGAIDQYDQPFADSSALPTFLVSKLAREHVTVVLSGDGSDETCGGYDRYVTLMRLHGLDRLGLHHLVPEGARDALSRAIGSARGLTGKMIKGLHALASSDAERHYFFMSYFRASKRTFYGPALRECVAKGGDAALFGSHMSRVDGEDVLRKILYLDARTYLVDDILYKVDIASMASSLEVRVPFLDHRLVEVAASIPSEYKVAHGAGKYFLKRLMEKRLPHQTLYRKKKGFEIPVSSWFRNELAPFLRETLLSSALLREPHFERSAIENTLREHQSGAVDHGPRLWILMALELWHRKLGGTFGD